MRRQYLMVIAACLAVGAIASCNCGVQGPSPGDAASASDASQAVDASRPADAAQTDSAAPDTAEPDSTATDAAMADVLMPDAAALDTSIPDIGLLQDAAAVDAAEADAAQADGAGLDAAPGVDTYEDAGCVDSDSDGVCDAFDCAPQHPDRWDTTWGYIDNDGDGYSGAEPFCLGPGQGLPPSHSDSPISPPMISFQGANSRNLDNGYSDWYFTYRALNPSTDYAHCDVGDMGACSALQVTGFGLEVPEEAAVEKVVFHVKRSAANLGQSETMQDFRVQLIVDNQPVDIPGLTQTEPWPAGGLGDWTQYEISEVDGQPLSPAAVSSSGFGIAIAPQGSSAGQAEARIWAVTLQAFVDVGADCDDADDTVYSTRPYYQDADRDGWGVEPELGRCVADVMPGSKAQRIGDCYDSHGSVSPDQWDWFDVERPGIGGWDYNCNGRIDKRQKRVASCSGSGGSCQTTYSSVTPSEGCGGNTWASDCHAFSCERFEYAWPVLCH